MAFIPNPNIISIGDRVRLRESYTMHLGTYTAGHEFVVTGETSRGYDMTDDDGRSIREFPTSKVVKVQPDETGIA